MLHCPLKHTHTQQEVAHKYQRRLAVYFTDGFNVIEAITILLLLGSGGCKVGALSGQYSSKPSSAAASHHASYVAHPCRQLSTSIVPTRSPPPTQLRRSRSLLSTIIRLPTFFCMPYYYITTRQAGMLIIGTSDPAWAQLRTAKDFLFNTTAMFLWLRALQVLLPLVGGLGALLMVTSKMVWEVRAQERAGGREEGGRKGAERALSWGERAGACKSHDNGNQHVCRALDPDPMHQGDVPSSRSRFSRVLPTPPVSRCSNSRCWG